MANRFRLWFSRNGGKAIITIILIIVFYKLVDRADKYYANQSNENSSKIVFSSNTDNSSNDTNIVNESNSVK